MGVISIVGAEGTESSEELRGLLDSERARRRMAEQRYDDALRSPIDRIRYEGCMHWPVCQLEHCIIEWTRLCKARGRQWQNNDALDCISQRQDAGGGLAGHRRSTAQHATVYASYGIYRASLDRARQRSDCPWKMGEFRNLHMALDSLGKTPG